MFALTMFPPVVRLDAWFKHRWHDELVRHPRTHAWVLNLYRAGEHHPETVDDYFPIDAVDDEELRCSMAKHRAEERAHEKLYRAAIEKLGGELEDFVDDDVFNVAIRKATCARFAMAKDADEATKRAAVAHFLAHAHFLESRIACSLEVHLAACRRAGLDDVVRLVEHVLRDETRHAAYTREWVHRLLPANQADETLEIHRRGEALANRRFSARQVRAHLKRHADLLSSSQRRRWSIAAGLLEVDAHRLAPSVAREDA
jgi:hypothetical protein